MNIPSKYITNKMLCDHITHLYDFSVFRHLLNVVLSLIITSRLSFNVTDKRFSEQQEGLCNTSISSFYNKILKKIIHKKNYVVTIKEMRPNVIIHECAHAIEKESALDITQGFSAAINHDLNNLHSQNIILQKKIQHLMVKALESYDQKSHLPELFARYFELFAFTKEVTDGKFSISNVSSCFKNTTKWIKNTLEPILVQKTIKEVSTYSLSNPPRKEHTTNWQRSISSNSKKSWSQRNTSLFD